MQIYLIRNLANGRWYVGATKKTAERRWKEHCLSARTGADTVLYSAIRKHGEASFVCDVLISDLENEGQLFAAEILTIALLKTIEKFRTYNMTGGGDGGAMPPEICIRTGAKRRGAKHSLETRLKMSRTHLNAYASGERPRPDNRGERHPMFGKKHSAESKIKIGACKKLQIGERNPFFGKKHSDETKRRISQTKLAQKEPLTPERREKLSRAVTAWWRERKKQHEHS